MAGPAYTLQSYAAAREELLARIHRGLQEDPRVVAAWLQGSYGRGEQDAVSDIDLAVVIDTPFAEAFSASPAIPGAFPAPERMRLFRRFGEPANLHESHQNTPAGGTFTSVLYRDPPVMVDWILLPRALAQRPGATLLLFDRAGIPRLPASRREIAAGKRTPPTLPERVAFFWMMAAVTAKYIARGRRREVEKFLSILKEVVSEIEGLLGQREAVAIPSPQPTGQPDRLRQLCDRVEVLTMSVPPEQILPAPRQPVEVILGIAPCHPSP